MKKIQIFILSTFLILNSACFNDNNQEIIASVNKKDLLLTEVIKEMPQTIEDSTFFVESYMNIWIRKQLMIYHAEMNIRGNLLEHEKQIKEYRSSLLIYAYQQQLINQNFDTTISHQAIIDYYTEYHKKFKLIKNIFKGRYIVVNKSAPKLKYLYKRYTSENQESVEKLTDYCQQFAKEYYLDDSSWQYFSTINTKLPELINNEEYFLQNTKDVWFEDKQYRYYVYIKDYQIKNTISPLALEYEKIHNVLLNKKKLQYLKQLENELYQNALALGKIKIY